MTAAQVVFGRSCSSGGAADAPVALTTTAIEEISSQRCICTVKSSGWEILLRHASVHERVHTKGDSSNSNEQRDRRATSHVFVVFRATEATGTIPMAPPGPPSVARFRLNLLQT